MSYLDYDKELAQIIRDEIELSSMRTCIVQTDSGQTFVKPNQKAVADLLFRYRGFVRILRSPSNILISKPKWEDDEIVAELKGLIKEDERV